MATARALYRVRQMKAANEITLALLDSPRIDYQRTILNLFRLEGKALKEAKKTLLKYITNQDSKNRADRIRQIGEANDPFSRSVLVAGALGKDDTLRGEFRYFVPGLSPETDGNTLKSLYEGGDDALKLTIVEVYNKLPSNALLPSFLTGKTKKKRARKRRGRSRSGANNVAVSRALGLLLAKHNEPASVDHLMNVLKSTDDTIEQKTILSALVPVMHSGAAKSIRGFTDKNRISDAELRWIAWGALMRANEKDALGRIDRWLNSDQPLKRSLATRSLGNKMMEKAVPRLNELLSDGQQDGRDSDYIAKLICRNWKQFVFSFFSLSQSLSVSVQNVNIFKK